MTVVSDPNTPVAKPRPRRSWLLKVGAVLAIFGPGLISANAGNDAGGILTYASAGSQFGYRMLFLMVLVTVGLVVVQEMCSRLGVYTGKGLGGLLREQFSVRSSTFALILLLIANAGLTVSEFAGVGAAFDIFGVPPYVSVPIAAVAVWALTVFGTYSKAERLFLILSLAFLAYPIAAFLGHPGAKQVFSNLLWPHFLHTHAFLVVAVALIGTTITPYMQFYVASAVVDKGVATGQLCQRAGGHGERRHLERHRQHVHHHRHRSRHRRHRTSTVRGASRQGTGACRGLGRSHSVRARAARGVAVGGVGGPALYLLRHCRRCGPATVHHQQLPAGTVVLRSLHAPDRGRCRHCPGARQPRVTGCQHPGPQRPHHSLVADVCADPVQPAVCAGQCRKRSQVQGRRHRVGRRGRNALLRCPPPDRGWALTAS